jgi:DNA-binding response OmpR family regulator
MPRSKGAGNSNLPPGPVCLGYPRRMSEQPTPVILLVDDDPAITRLLEVNFRLVGFRVAAVSRGDVALERARAVPPSAIVLDVMLPGLGGYEVCRQMRAIPTLAEVPVVFLTARSPNEEENEAGGLGPIDFVGKPFEPADLVELVRKRVAERQAR